MIETILQAHFTRYPAMQIQDLYKLLHQAAMGSEHAVADPEPARNWLMRELAELGDGPLEPLIDPLSPGGDIVRIHLRPFVVAGYDQEQLLDVFVRTANEVHGDVGQLEQFWQDATHLENFPVETMNEFMDSMRANKYPAVHHSPEYEKEYRPAYRVVARAFCPAKWLLR